MSAHDMIGRRFSMLLVLERAADHVTPRGKTHAKFSCICDCGKSVDVLGTALRGNKQGSTKSCGCLKASGEPYVTHGATKARGSVRGSAYSSWTQMKARCTNPNASKFHLYGGRGITVCERWMNSFENFLADMGARPNGTSIDRHPDNEGNYEPGNCRWATASEQNSNRRKKVVQS